MQDQANATPAPKRVPLEQGKADRGKATAATQTRLVDPDETPDRRSHARSRHVQSGDRQQAPRLRRRGNSRSMTSHPAVMLLTGHSSPKEDWSAGQVRTDRDNTASDRRLHQGGRQEAGRLSVRRPAGTKFPSNHSAVRAVVVRLGCQCWARSTAVRNTLTAPNEGDPDLREDRQLASRAALVGPHKNREHR
jgi:hypothetical protein